MTLNLFFPPEAVLWLTRYGVFVVVLLFAALAVALAMRPFWMWYSGKSEVLERLKRLEADSRKSLMELEMLNHTLAIPVKKAAQKARATEKAEEPLVVTEATKADFLKALEKSRTRLLDEED